MVERSPKRRRRSPSSSSSSSSSTASSGSSSSSSGSSSSSRSRSPRRNRAPSAERTIKRRSRSRSIRRQGASVRGDRLDRTVSSRHSPPRRTSPRRVSPKRETRRSRSKSPITRVSVRNVSRNVHKEHLTEIFGVYGTVKKVDLPPDSIHAHLSRGHGYVEFEKAEDAEKAWKHLDGGQIDGLVIRCELSKPARPRPTRDYRRTPPRRRPSPPRGGGGGASGNPNRIPLGTARRSRSR